MDIQEIKTKLDEFAANIGKPFKCELYLGWDIVVSVDRQNRIIHGEKLSADIDLCRLKQDQPEHLKNHNQQ